VAYFYAAENDALCHHLMPSNPTTSPSKNHVLHPLFSKPPSKNTHKTAKTTHSRRPKNILEKTGLG
jgi:hypothetical protein